jgi:hypothetical protein
MSVCEELSLCSVVSPDFVHDSAGGDSDQNPLIVYQVAWNVEFKGMTFLTQSSLGVQSCDQQVYIS